MSHVNLLCGVWAGPVAWELADPHLWWWGSLGATKRARRSSKRSTTPTNTAIPTIRIRGAHKPRDNRARDQESPPNREPGSTARGTTDVSGFRPLDTANDGGVRLAAQRTTRPQQTRSHATTHDGINGGTHRQVPCRYDSRPNANPQAQPNATSGGINGEADQHASN